MNPKEAKELAYPKQVMIQTTSRCNSSCVICPYPYLQKNFDHGDMTDEVYTNLIDEISSYPALDRLMLYLMNEPLCDKKIVDRIEFARSKLPETEIYILTNGANLTDDMADRLIDSGLSWIGLSVHAIRPETYLTITGRKDFSKMRDRMERFASNALSKRGEDFLQVNITRVRPHVSQEEFEEAADFWTSLGVARVDLDNGYISRAGNVKVHGHEPVLHHHVSGCKTIWAYIMAHVLYDGTVIPCCMDWTRKVIFGNIAKQSLLDAWRSDVRMAFLDTLDSGDPLDDDFLCAKCEDAIAVKQEEPEKIIDSKDKSADILLVNPPPWLPYSPPLGIASLAAYLSKQGFTAEVLDANIELFAESHEAEQALWEWEEGPLWEKDYEVDRIFGQRLDDIARRIADHPAPIVGFSVASRKEYALARIVKTLMQLAPDKDLIFGGPGVCERADRDRIHEIIGEDMAATGGDILYGFVVGEGEAVLSECLANLQDCKTIEEIEGVAIYREGGQANFKPRSKAIKTEGLPFPDFSQFPLDKYTHPSLTVEWSRGCIGQCVFCNIRELWGAYRSKGAKQVVDELEHLVKQYDKTWFSICDPVINGRPKVLEEICDDIISRELSIKWSAGISPTRELTPEQFVKMQKAGCYRLEFGVESAADNVLETMGKRYDAETAGRMLDACKAAGIEVVLYLIVGFPVETEEDFQKTLAFLEKHGKSIDRVRSVNGLILVPGAPIEKSPNTFGMAEPDRNKPGWVSRWTASDLTPEVRVSRIDRVLTKLEELCIPAEFSNREELLGEKEMYTGRAEEIEKRLSSFEERMRTFLDLQDKVLRGEPIRPNPYAEAITLVLLPVWGIQNPPLGLSYLAAFLRNQGWKPEVIDYNAELFHKAGDTLRTLFAEENFRHWTDPASFNRIRNGFSPHIDALVDQLIASNRKVIGFSVYSPNRLFTIEVCRRLKQRAPDRVLIAGGRGVFTENERLLFPPDTIDYFVVGDGEVTVVPLLEAIFADRDGSKLPGVVRFEGHNLTPLHPRPVYEDLTIFPHPTFEGLNLDLYTDEELPLLFSRGCTGHCTFCNDHKAMGRYRTRPADHMFAEVMWHVKTHSRRSFKFNDQLINGDLEQLERFCDLIIEEGEPVKWIALAQPKGDMPDRLLQKMKAAGCFTLNLGIESGSEKVLKRMGKGFTVSDIEKSLAQTFAAGINTMVNFIVGFPGETESDFQATLEFIRRNRPNICGVTSVNTCIVLEGSPLEIGAKTFGIQFPPENKDVGWWAGENTPELRNDRAIRLVALLEELNIPSLVSNLREQVADLEGMGLPDTMPEPLPQVPEPVAAPHDASCLPAAHEFDEEKGKPYFEQIDMSDADILLMMLPVWGTDVAPLGLAYLSEAIGAKGMSASILDLNIKLYNRTKDRTLWRMESYKYWTDPALAPATFESFAKLIDHYVEQIAKHPAPIIGFSVVTGNFPFTMHVAEKIRAMAPDKTIIFGGPGITNSFDIATITHAQGDYLVLGDGEHVLFDLMQAILKGQPADFQGVIPVGTPIDFDNLPKALVRELNELPYPRFENFNLVEYESDAVPILTSRGCIRRCSFCNDHHIGQKYRWRDPKQVFKEIEYHVKNRGADRFTLLDVLINGRPKALEQLCDLIIESGYQVRWGGQGVIREEMSQTLLRKMKAAGCMSMVYGIESFSDKVLKLMNKPYTQELAKEILRRTHAAGIETIINIIVGFPGEGEDEFNETFEFLRDNQATIDQVASISPCLVNLGSRLFDRYPDYGIRFPQEEGSIKWDTADGNTFEIRRRRVLELTSLLSKREKSVHTVNLYDERREDFEYIEHQEKQAEEKKTAEQAGIDAFLILLPPWGIEFPPIGLATLATYARAKGFTLQTADCNIEWYDRCGDYLKQWWEPERLKLWMPGEHLDQIMAFLAPAIDELIDSIKKANPRLVGFSTNESNLTITELVAKRVFQDIPNAAIILGGPGTCWPLDRAPLSKDGIDGFVIGEGEETFVDILAHLKDGRQLLAIPGFESTSEAGSFETRDLIRPLDNIPAPDFREFPLHLYTRKEIPLLFSRGCVGRCAFCNDYLITPKFRIKKPETLIEEVKKYKREQAAFEFAFNDLLLNADLKALEQFCDTVISEDIRMAWTGQAVIDKRMDGAFMQKLRQAGCSSLVFGAESFSPVVLKKMRKRFQPEDAKQVFAAAHAARIEVIINIIVGFPGESEKEFSETLDFIRENRANIDRVSALSTCIVVAQSDLEKRPDHYDICLPKPEHWRQWYSNDESNTYEIRAERMERVLDLLNELKISHGMTNRYMEVIEEKR